jgi:hypothetical protein
MMVAKEEEYVRSGRHAGMEFEELNTRGSVIARRECHAEEHEQKMSLGSLRIEFQAITSIKQ